MSTSSSNVSDTVGAQSSNSGGTAVAPPSFSHFITVKLTLDNHLLWKAQILPYLRSQNLIGYVDGSIRKPSATIAETRTEGETHQVVNPEYTTWFQQDQLVLSALLSSMTEAILGQVLFLSSAAEVWAALEDMFASQTRGRTMQIRLQLANLKKKDLSITANFHKVKNLADQLASAGHRLHEEEIVSYLLSGLGTDYDAVVTSIATRSDTVSLNELYAHLINFEARHELQEANRGNTLPMGNNVMRQEGRGGGGRYGGRRGRGQGRGYNGGRGNNTNFNNNSNRPTCQVCGKLGLDALRCYHRFNHAYQAEDANKSAAAAAYKVDTNWYMDTGATDHLTSELDRLTFRERYKGGDQVQAANGAGSCHEENSAPGQG